MKIWLTVAAVAALVLTSLGGFLIIKYGDARYEAGKASAVADNATKAETQSQKDNAAYERNARDSRKLSDADLDADLVDLGIMRPDSDR